MSKIEKYGKLIIIISVVFVFLVLLPLCLYLLLNKDPEVVFTLNGGFEIIEYGDDYVDQKCTVMVDGVDKSGDVKFDVSNVILNKTGLYKEKYYIFVSKKEYNIYRYISVVDTENPVINLNGDSNVVILINEDYQEEGYTAYDNYDGDITDRVVISNNIDNKNAGIYTISYQVSDTSGNCYSVDRTVEVKIPNIVTVENVYENKSNIDVVSYISYDDTITSNKFTSNGFYIEGNSSISSDNFVLKFIGENEYNFSLELVNNNKYKGNINISDVVNGSYQLYINDNKLINKMNLVNRILRAKVNDKLLTFNYDNNIVSLVVEDFIYQYDVLIDPGHGGTDSGAINQYVYEKNMNLTISLYEKCRFESHGYSVYMTRSDDTYGNGLGDSSLSRLHRRGYEMGYYGAVSKIVYSNHNNAISNNYYSGYEIIVGGSLTSDELVNEIEIKNKFNNIYQSLDNHLRFYSRDYESESKYSMLSGNNYSFNDYYAVIRIPKNVFNVKSVIYEGTYLTNIDDFNWYWRDKNWIKVSEAKLETYINYLGGNYNSDNSSCL